MNYPWYDLDMLTFKLKFGNENRIVINNKQSES